MCNGCSRLQAGQAEYLIEISQLKRSLSKKQMEPKPAASVHSEDPESDVEEVVQKLDDDDDDDNVQPLEAGSQQASAGSTSKARCVLLWVEFRNSSALASSMPEDLGL